MPPPYARHVFVCTNRRADGHPKGCCASKGSEDVRIALKKEMDRRGVEGVQARGLVPADRRERPAAGDVEPAVQPRGGRREPGPRERRPEGPRRGGGVVDLEDVGELAREAAAEAAARDVDASGDGAGGEVVSLGGERR